MSRLRPTPVRPRRKDELDYERAINRTYVRPILDRLRDRLSQAVSANQALAIMDDVFRGAAAAPVSGLVTGQIQLWFDRIRRYHRRRIIETFRAALRVDVALLLLEPGLNEWMRRKLVENVDLIVTIPPRSHASLVNRLTGLLETHPFDQLTLMEALRREYRSTGYNVRRITRDQTSKAIGQLTEIRQRQMGVERYQWITAQDERVRPTHAANSGQIFDWGSPPPDTGPPGQDIQCRCVASPILTEEQVTRIKDIAGPLSITGIAA